MPGLTENERRAFARQLLEVLRNNTARLTDAGYDPAGRIRELEAKAQAADQQEAAQRAAEEAKLRATNESNAATGDVYQLASATVDLIVGIVGKDDELANVLRGIRRGMSRGSNSGGSGGDPPA